jgi:hypothetical protein
MPFLKFNHSQSGCKPHDVIRLNILNRAARALHPPCAGYHDQGRREAQTSKWCPPAEKHWHGAAAGSPEKQKINDDEGCDHATGAEGEHVTKVVSGHALARLDCSFDDPFVVPFRHQGLSLLR